MPPSTKASAKLIACRSEPSSSATLEMKPLQLIWIKLQQHSPYGLEKIQSRSTTPDWGQVIFIRKKKIITIILENVSLATHLSANLTPLQREEVRRVCERLFAQRNDRMASLWNDLQSQNLKLHFRTASGKSFSLAGAGWQEEGDQTAQNMEETVAPEEPSLG